MTKVIRSNSGNIFTFTSKRNPSRTLTCQVTSDKPRITLTWSITEANYSAELNSVVTFLISVPGQKPTDEECQRAVDDAFPLADLILADAPLSKDFPFISFNGLKNLRSIARTLAPAKIDTFTTFTFIQVLRNAELSLEELMALKDTYWLDYHCNDFYATPWKVLFHYTSGLSFSAGLELIHFVASGSHETIAALNVINNKDLSQLALSENSWKLISENSSLSGTLLNISKAASQGAEGVEWYKALTFRDLEILSYISTEKLSVKYLSRLTRYVESQLSLVSKEYLAITSIGKAPELFGFVAAELDKEEFERVGLTAIATQRGMDRLLSQPPRKSDGISHTGIFAIDITITEEAWLVRKLIQQLGMAHAAEFYAQLITGGHTIDLLAAYVFEGHGKISPEWFVALETGKS